jgi:hypothetical protein
MHATADSRIAKSRGAVISGSRMVVFILNTKPPNKFIKRCPALKFADSRINKIRGRVIFLTSSIITMNIINAEGVFLGRR